MYNVSMSFLTTLQYSFIDFVTSLLKWPLWWYSTGLVAVLKTLWRTFDYQWKSMAVGVWIKNIFVPMFGQRDWQSRIISFIMRVVNIIGRSFAGLIWAMILMLVAVIYVAWLPIIVTLLYLSIYA